MNRARDSRWWDVSWNLLTGCSPRSEGCANCWAEPMARRLAGRYGYSRQPHHFDVTFHPERLADPFKWKKPRRIFVCNMGDLFHEDVRQDQIELVFAVMKAAPWHTYLILTKRPYLMKSIEPWQRPPRLWFGITAENMERFEERLYPGPYSYLGNSFVSFEPLLGPISAPRWIAQVDGVIAGCESGPRRRPAKIEWFRSLRDQCAEYRVPFYLKQMEVDGQVEHLPELDGQRHTATPWD